jgi:transposase
MRQRANWFVFDDARMVKNVLELNCRRRALLCDQVCLAAQVNGIESEGEGSISFFDKDGQLILRRVHAERRWDGVSFIFTTSPFTIDDTIKAYFDKDVVEKSFQALKGVVRLRPIRHWLYNHVEAHVFICYLSCLLLALLKMKVAPLGISFQEALHELDGLYRVYLRDPKSGFKLGRLITLTKRQEQILRGG